jgi:hypothetical protein
VSTCLFNYNLELKCVGYKQRDKITKALSSRGDAIKTALKLYADAAAAMSPPRAALTWKEVVEMATLADFDLLRDVKNSALTKRWAKPRIREAMRLHFRIKRAHEEIHRLNVEIKRQTTYMRDEYFLYSSTAAHLQSEDPNLSHKIAEEGKYRSVIFSGITYYLLKTSRLKGFTGALTPGIRKGIHSMRPVLPENPQWLACLDTDGKVTVPEAQTDGERWEMEPAPEETEEADIMLEWTESLAI